MSKPYSYTLNFVIHTFFHPFLKYVHIISTYFAVALQLYYVFLVFQLITH